MANCASCGGSLAIAVRFCPSCGASVGSDEVATLASDNSPTVEFGSPAPQPVRPGSSTSSKPPGSSAFSMNEGRFLPGRLLAGRYRIIALLGKGGMGEVYRADDLTLGQPVALKFLPEEASNDESLLERFRNEVRIARRVSHPNVCRVYDVGEVDGNTFFTMEYVDGEDLASLLRRIGRLPQDKAVDIARQLCAGLAAAHSKGVLHRDLKPANIMLDGRGQVVMTDFGLAGLSDQIRGPEVRSGTPAYMAPEQLAGKEVSAQSDIYSLGLVLYEIFTGKRAFTPETLAELVRTGTQSAPSRPSSVVKDLDPAVERVILRCLEHDPRNRPATALSIAAALPGGDPLAAALAAGETPSPQMVAAAGEIAGLSRRVALSCLAAVLVGLGAAVYLTARMNALDRFGAELSPEVLSQKARETVARLGYDQRPADSAFGFYYNTSITDYVEKNDKPHPQWDDVLAARPPVLEFWYRQSPRYLVASDINGFLLIAGEVDKNDPPPTLSGMIRVSLDPRGRLTFLEAIPPERVESTTSSSNFDWKTLFDAAGFDMTQFQSAQPQWNSLASADVRAAWTGKWPGTNRDLRIEAAAFRGKPVYFALIGPWTHPQRMNPEESSLGKKFGNVLGLTVLIALIVFSVLLARRNHRQGRGDHEGAARLAKLVFVLLIGLWMLRAHHVMDFGEVGTLILTTSTALFLSAMTFVLYLAAEPYVRKFWPHSIISWSRLLTGRIRDPLVGRDVMLGVVLGVIWIAIFKIARLIAMRMGEGPDLYSTDFLEGTRRVLGAWLYQVPASILATLEFFFLALVLKVLLRRDWPAAIAFVAIFSALRASGAEHLWVQVPLVIVVYSIAVLIIYRFGLISLACAVFTVDLLANVPFTADLSAWYMGTSIFALLSVVALAAWGFHTSLAGKPLWNPDAQ